MRLLIDGYNLLFQSVALQQDMNNKNALRQARGRLVSLVLDLIDESVRSRTMIVFDAKEAPPGLPARYQDRGIEIVFARDWDSADELIQLEIRKHPTPKLLTVVSSDHAIHRKALARGATVLDCDDWIDEQLNQRERRRQQEASVDGVGDHDDAKQREVSESEKSEWLDKFGF
jgi:predicted RNA-binding protein with PIN domain